MLIVMIATEWGPAEGGINAFNQQLAIGLASVCGPAAKIACAITGWSSQASADAEKDDVLLIPIEGDENGRPVASCGKQIVTWLREHGIAEPISLWVGHDTVTGNAAVEAAQDGGRLALIHHMDYHDYQNLDAGRGEKTTNSQKLQTDLFSTEGAILFGVGTELAATASRLSLSGRDAGVLVPGFPTSFKRNVARDSSVRAFASGRFETAAESLKQSRLAAAAMGLAVLNSNGLIATLSAPSISFIGVEKARVESGELEALVREEARRHVNVVPGIFETDPEAMVDQLAQSNLAIMPSYREGFGLAGWEAIGCEVPLILGRETGLFKFIEQTLGGSGTGCIWGIELRGGLDLQDKTNVANAITEIAKDLRKARADAAGLKKQLMAACGCTWNNTADQFLTHLAVEGVAIATMRKDSLRNSPGSPETARAFRYVHANHYAECAELQVTTGQGSQPESFEILAELRFGTTAMQLGNLSVEVFLRAAQLQVVPTGGTIRGGRLGDHPHLLPGIQPRAGGIWSITDPDRGDAMLHKALGDDALCRIEAPLNTPTGATLEVTAGRLDICCLFKSPLGRKSPDKATEKVMQIFLQNCIVKERNGRILLSEAKIIGD